MAKKKPAKRAAKEPKPAEAQPPKQPATTPQPATALHLPQDDPTKKPFTPIVLDKSIIAPPLIAAIKKDELKEQEIIIDLNLEYTGGREKAREDVEMLIDSIIQTSDLNASRNGWKPFKVKNSGSKQYIFARLPGTAIKQLAQLDGATASRASGRVWGAIYRIWPDFPVEPLITKSLATVKADAARNSFSAVGDDIMWAVMDSGIDSTHKHFAKHSNLLLPLPLQHQDFTDENAPLNDRFGHGTHVAGIIAGEAERGIASRRFRDENGDVRTESEELTDLRGMAAKCKLLSLKVLNKDGKGQVSNLMAAINFIQEVNGYGRRIRIHGVNMSVGYGFEPEWFACGQSPLCVEVDRLVKSGVVVVVAAGNSGYGSMETEFRGVVSAGIAHTINDPGNAELAITVGSTHRDMPHIYGVSYFSSKGPTGDGRMKPDLLAPGEKIISCASTQIENGPKNSVGLPQYMEDSGTSMAAPHVAGAIAAFLSVRREFIGQPERVKEIFLNTATDLRRVPSFQGRGLVDLMRAMQSV